MNPLPFFPPPTRAFSQQGRNPHSNSTEHRSASSTSSNRRVGGGGHSSAAGGHFSGLRATLSQHGLRDSSSAPSSKGSRPGSSGVRTPSYPLVGSAQVSPGASTLHVNATGGNAGQMEEAISETSSNNSTGGAAAASDTSPTAQIFSPTSAGGDRSEPGSASVFRKAPRMNTLSIPSGRTGMNLPKGLFFDWVRPEEIAQCHALETQAYDPEDQASKERFKYRQGNAPHLFLGAYIPSAPPKVAGPLSVGHNSTPRRIIGFINGTASSSMSARSLAVHTVSNEEEGEEAWLVCLASIVVEESFRRKGLGLRLLEEYIMRLRRAEEGRGDPKRGQLEQPKGYECVGLLTHEETIKFFLKAGFKVQGVSHVRVGSGGWVEMRRYIKGRQQQHGEGNREKAEIMAATSSTGSEIKETSSDPTQSKQTEEKSVAANDAELNASEVPSSMPLTPRRLDPVSLTDNGVFTGSPKDLSPTEESSSVSKPSMAARPPPSQGFGAFSQADLLAALSAASSGYVPGTNPSQPFSSILGQTLAGKTFVEDAFVALEAHLVDKRKGKGDLRDGHGGGGNLAEIWCPREECGCKLIRKGVAMWELAESGPLTDGRLCSESLPSGASSLPPTPQPPPAPVSHIRALKVRERERAKRSNKGGSDDEDNTRSTLPGAPPSGEVTTPIRPFWSLLSPMSFENIAFSKDVKWKVPLPPLSTGSDILRSMSGDEEMVASPSPTSHNKGNFSSASEHGPFVTGGGEKGGGETSSPEKRKMPRRPTFFGRKNMDKAQVTNTTLKIQHPSDLLSSTTAGYGEVVSPVGGPPSTNNENGGTSRARTPSGSGSGSGSEPWQNLQQQQNQRQQQTLTVKYLLCPNCDTGPLGYTIVPTSLQGGKMGLSVGEELDAGSGGGGGSVNTTKELQVFLLAAERVRYRFVK